MRWLAWHIVFLFTIFDSPDHRRWLTERGQRYILDIFRHILDPRRAHSSYRGDIRVAGPYVHRLGRGIRIGHSLSDQFPIGNEALSDVIESMAIGRSTRMSQRRGALCHR